MKYCLAIGATLFIFLVSIGVIGQTQKGLKIPLSLQEKQQRNLSVNNNSDVGQNNSIEKRVALVIGNSTYKVSPLRNPINDARDLAGVLKEVGFDVSERENLTKREMEDEIRAFGRKIKGGAVGLFYFSGHGAQLRDRNYLIPVSCNIEKEEDLEYEAVDAGRILAEMSAAENKLNILILDACRNNPFAKSFRSVSSGLAQMSASSGTIIAYATSPGSVASDGQGKNGLYTGTLLKYIKEPGLGIEQVFKKVRAEVEEKSGRKQLPWESSSLKGDFYFRLNIDIEVGAKPKEETKPAVSYELEFWNSIKNSSNSEEYEAYLKKYPAGEFAEIAKSRIKRFALSANPISSNSTETNNTFNALTPTMPKLNRFNFTTALVGSTGNVSEKRNRQANYYVEELSNGVMLEMVEIPAGTFYMGSSQQEAERFRKDLRRYRVSESDALNFSQSETPRHQVKVSEIFMGKFEVSQEQWQAIMGNNPSQFKGNNLPVENVTWSDAMEFCRRLTEKTGRKYRLPTEAEWEYACRAGSSTTAAFGDTVTSEIVNFNGNFPFDTAKPGINRAQTSPIGSLGVANEFGLYDMHGNVWEWCLDLFHENYQGAPTDGSAWESGGSPGIRITRGGAWYDCGYFSRSATRFRYTEKTSFPSYGLRVVSSFPARIGPK